jgi:hypothetical protein
MPGVFSEPASALETGPASILSLPTLRLALVTFILHPDDNTPARCILSSAHSDCGDGEYADPFQSESGGLREILVAWNSSSCNESGLWRVRVGHGHDRSAGSRNYARARRLLLHPGRCRQLHPAISLLVQQGASLLAAETWLAPRGHSQGGSEWPLLQSVTNTVRDIQASWLECDFCYDPRQRQAHVEDHPIIFVVLEFLRRRGCAIVKPPCGQGWGHSRFRLPGKSRRNQLSCSDRCQDRGHLQSSFRREGPENRHCDPFQRRPAPRHDYLHAGQARQRHIVEEGERNQMSTAQRACALTRNRKNKRTHSPT